MQDYLLTALGQRVRELRAKAGFSQEGFADHIGVHRTFVGTIERGESNLSFGNLAKISKALGITLSQLLTGIEKKAEAISKTPPSGQKPTRAEKQIRR